MFILRLKDKKSQENGKRWASQELECEDEKVENIFLSYFIKLGKEHKFSTEQIEINSVFFKYVYPHLYPVASQDRPLHLEIQISGVVPSIYLRSLQQTKCW